jgi:hypothetical protein
MQRSLSLDFGSTRYILKLMLLVVFALVTLLFFFKSLFVYFAQDDFYLLEVSRISSINDFFTFFLPLPDVVWYRPLSSQIFFFFGRVLFGLKPLYFHIVVLVTHVLTGFILYHFTDFLFKSKKVGVIAAVLYLSHQLHVVSLGWLAAYSFVIGPLFFVAQLYTFIRKKYLVALILFSMGIFSSEVNIISFFSLGVYFLLFKQHVHFKLLTSYFLLSIAVIILRLVVFPTETHSSLYAFSMSLDMVETFKFYILRLVGFPMLFDELAIPVRLIYMIAVGLISTFLMIGLRRLVLKQVRLRVLLWLTATGFLGLLPFLFLKDHLAPHYMSFALMGFAPLVAFLLNTTAWNVSKKYALHIITAVVFIFLILQSFGGQLTYSTHWIFQRAARAKVLVEKQEFIHPVGSEDYYSLGGESARIFFEHE